jgi:hypothetical protein
MRTRHEFRTQEEANAFSDGVNLVGDIDVETTSPVLEEREQGSEWVVYVTVGEEAFS